MSDATKTIPTAVRGRYCLTWTGRAHQNLPAQMPLIAATFPEITRCHPATVNVRFGPLVVVAGVDHRTPPLKWKATGEDGEAGEVFDFVRGTLTFERLGVSAAALLVVSHWSLHRLDPHKHEFLVESFVAGLADGDAVTFACDRPAVELPYSKVDATDPNRHARTVVIL